MITAEPVRSDICLYTLAVRSAYRARLGGLRLLPGSCRSNLQLLRVRMHSRCSPTMRPASSGSQSAPRRVLRMGPQISHPAIGFPHPHLRFSSRRLHRNRTSPAEKNPSNSPRMLSSRVLPVRDEPSRYKTFRREDSWASCLSCPAVGLSSPDVVSDREIRTPSRISGRSGQRFGICLNPECFYRRCRDRQPK
jgi:hypothetical protein